jgi:hypothetical protein
MVDTTFTREVALPVPVEEAFAWHERPGALDRLIPPWEAVRIERRSTGVNDGVRVVLCNRIGPFRVRWIAEHFDYEKNRQFRDRQVSGPFKRWEHLHSFHPTGPGTSVMKDHIQYRIPGGPLGRILAKGFVRDKLGKMFAYRHDTTTADLAAHARYKEKGTMHIAITGSHGLVGSVLVPFLTTGGHRITRIVRGTAGEGEMAWNPGGRQFEAAGLDGIDAVVHLAGENIASRRWGAAQKKRIRDSRVNGTRLLCERLARMQAPPKVLISASAIGYYGDRGDESLDESSPPGHGFLAEVAEAWEAAAEPAVGAGIRVVNLRLGVILSPIAGGLAKMLTPFKLGGGGMIGNGRQYWSWISIDDVVGAILHVIMTDSLSGPVNIVAPNAVTNREFTKTLGRVLSRPTLVPMPAAAARLALGEMANELLLASARVEPKRLLESGYEFRHAELEPALRHLLGRQSCTVATA